MGPGAAVDELEFGDHACYGVRSASERIDVLGRYVTAGLERVERIVCVTGASGLLDDLDDAGVAGAHAARSGQLVVSTRDAVLGSDGLVRPSVLAHFRTAVDQALLDGFRGLRLVSDACAFPVATRVRPDFVRFELAREGLLTALPITALCLYDAVGATDQQARLISALHPTPVGALPAPLFGVRWLGPAAVAVEGEIDLGSAGAWEMLLDAVTGGGERTLDLGHLEFIDVAGLRALLRAVDAAPVRLRRVPPLVRRIVQVLGMDELTERMVG